MIDFASKPDQAHSASSPVIALVRHGETSWNQEHRIQGRTEVPLNDTGRDQAAAAGRQLAALAGETPTGKWVGIRSSPLGRAMETAALISPALALGHPEIDDAFLERDFGPAEGLKFAEVNERWPGLEVPGAETLSALAERAAGAIARALDTAPNTVVVAHGALLRSGLSALMGTEIPRILNGDIWLLRRTANGFEANLVSNEHAAAESSHTA